MPQQQGERTPAQVFLQPLAAPSILGLYGFAGATFMVAANMAHWFGNSQTALFLAEATHESSPRSRLRGIVDGFALLGFQRSGNN